MTHVRLPASVRAELVAHARAESPDECCGMLVGREGVIAESVRMRNAAANRRTRYLVDPADHIALVRRVRGTGRAIMGVYHSHPSTPALPSPADCAEALYPEFVWLIVSLAGPSPHVAAFTLTGGDVQPMTIVAE